MSSLSVVWTLIDKELRIEYRAPQALLTTLFFALLILVIFNFAFDPGNPAMVDAAPGILWVSLLFPGVIQLNRSFQSEREEGTLHALVLTPVDRGLLFLGKFLANWTLLLLVDLVVLGAFVFFFNLELTLRLLWLLLLIALASMSLSAVGTLFASIVSSIASREVLLPILLFPIIVPVIIAAVSASREVLSVAELQHVYSWVRLLVGCDVVFVAGAYVLFDFVVGD